MPRRRPFFFFIISRLHRHLSLFKCVLLLFFVFIIIINVLCPLLLYILCLWAWLSLCVIISFFFSVYCCGQRPCLPFCYYCYCDPSIFLLVPAIAAGCRLLFYLFCNVLLITVIKSCIERKFFLFFILSKFSVAHWAQFLSRIERTDTRLQYPGSLQLSWNPVPA